MVLSMLLALTTCPAMLGTQEAIRQSQSKERREEHRARRCNLITSCVKSSIRSREINGRRVVLRDHKLYIDTATAPEDVDDNEKNNSTPDAGHPFAGYFLPYPDSAHEGLVSTITDEAPILNWIYVDRETCEVKYGVRLDAQPHATGPFDCTRLDRRMTLDGWEGFVAVEEYPAVWALYFDLEDDGLRGKVPFGTRVLEVELSRREKKMTMEARREQEELLEKQRQQQQQQQQQDTENEEYLPQQTHEEKTEEDGYDTQNQFDETDFAKLRIDTGLGPVLSAEHAEGTVGTPTDAGCGASIWSAPEEQALPGKLGSIASYATPDSSVHGDDEVAAAEAIIRQNDEVGAPPSPLKYKKPYVEDE